MHPLGKAATIRHRAPPRNAPRRRVRPSPGIMRRRFATTARCAFMIDRLPPAGATRSDAAGSRDRPSRPTCWSSAAAPPAPPPRRCSRAGAGRCSCWRRTRHPRFHIGESLLPMNLPILERLGVLEQVRAIGVLKPRRRLPGRRGGNYNVFRFDRALDAGSSATPSRSSARSSTSCCSSMRAPRRRCARRRQGRARRVRRRRPPGQRACAQRRWRGAARPRRATWSMPAAATRCSGSKLKLKQKQQAAPVGGDVQPLHRRRAARQARTPATSPSSASSTAGCG